MTTGIQETNEQKSLLQLGANLLALDNAGDWIGKRLTTGRYGMEKCSTATTMALAYPEALPKPDCSIQPSCHADNAEFLHEEFKLDLDTALSYGQQGLAEAFRHGINLIEQNCLKSTP